MSEKIKFSKVIQLAEQDYWQCVKCDRWSEGNLYSCGWQYCRRCGAYPVRDQETEEKFQKRIKIMEEGLKMLNKIKYSNK